MRVSGNDPELDSDREPEPPTKTIDKPAARHGKRDAPREAPAAPATAPTAPRGGARGRGGRGNGNDEGELSAQPCIYKYKTNEYIS